MNLRARTAATAAASALATLALTGLTATPAAAIDPVKAAKSFGGGALYNAGHAIYVVKDLGGGAYWNVTTNSLYVAETGGDIAVDLTIALTEGGEELLATAVVEGQEALLLVNGTVIVPVQEALSP